MTETIQEAAEKENVKIVNKLTGYRNKYTIIKDMRQEELKEQEIYC